MGIRFTLRELFVAWTLLGVGLGGLAVVFGADASRAAGWKPIVLFFSVMLIGTGLGVLLNWRKTGAIVGLVVGFVLAFVDKTQGADWVGRTDLEIQFVVTDEESGRPVPNARVEILSDEPYVHEFVLNAAADGIARMKFPHTVCIGTQSGLSLTDTYGVELVWSYRGVAKGFHPGHWMTMYNSEQSRSARRLGPGRAELVVKVPLREQRGRNTAGAF